MLRHSASDLLTLRIASAVLSLNALGRKVLHENYLAQVNPTEVIANIRPRRQPHYLQQLIGSISEQTK